MNPDPRHLLRLARDPDAYPTEASDEEVAEAAGVDPGEIVRFDMNTLGGGPLRAVVEAHAAYDPGRAVEYGDQQYRALRRALGGHLGLDPARVVIGAGADELIRLVTRLFAGEGDAVAVPTPTFGMFSVEAGLVGATVVEIARSEPGRRQEPDRIVADAGEHAARLVWLCTPNNPTGDAFTLDEVESIASRVDAAVAVDEAYLEFAAAELGRPVGVLSALALQERLPNLLVLRSMAKAYGLAGARIGYLVVPAWLAPRADAERLPLAVGSHTETLALAALDDPDGAGERHRLVVGERRRISERLAGYGWRVLPSVTNFLLTRPPGGESATYASGLLQRGLVVRAYEPGSSLAGWIRITARIPAENDRLLRAIGEIGSR